MSYEAMNIFARWLPRANVLIYNSLLFPPLPTECLVYIQIFTGFSRIGFFGIFGQKTTVEVVPTRKRRLEWRHRACDYWFNILTHPISFSRSFASLQPLVFCMKADTESSFLRYISWQIGRFDSGDCYKSTFVARFDVIFREQFFIISQSSNVLNSK